MSPRRTHAYKPLSLKRRTWLTVGAVDAFWFNFQNQSVRDLMHLEKDTGPLPKFRKNAFVAPARKFSKARAIPIGTVTLVSVSSRSIPPT